MSWASVITEPTSTPPPGPRSPAWPCVVVLLLEVPLEVVSAPVVVAPQAAASEMAPAAAIAAMVLRIFMAGLPSDGGDSVGYQRVRRTQARGVR